MTAILFFIAIAKGEKVCLISFYPVSNIYIHCYYTVDSSDSEDDKIIEVKGKYFSRLKLVEWGMLLFT